METFQQGNRDKPTDKKPLWILYNLLIVRSQSAVSQLTVNDLILLEQLLSLRKGWKCSAVYTTRRSFSDNTYGSEYIVRNSNELT